MGEHPQPGGDRHQSHDVAPQIGGCGGRSLGGAAVEPSDVDEPDRGQRGDDRPLGGHPAYLVAWASSPRSNRQHTPRGSTFQASC